MATKVKASQPTGSVSQQSDQKNLSRQIRCRNNYQDRGERSKIFDGFKGEKAMCPKAAR